VKSRKKTVPGRLSPTGTPFAEIIGVAKLSPGSNWRRNQTRANPAWIGGACDTAAANVGPDMHPVSAWRQMPISIALTSRILDVISLTSVCRRMTGPGHQFAVSRASITMLTRLLRLPRKWRSPRQTIASRGCNIRGICHLLFALG
jgi:hypothetical protein